MRKSFLLFKTLCLLVSIAIFASCSSQKSIYETLIPVNPKSLVAGIKLNQVLTKSDIKTLLPEAARAHLLETLISETEVQSLVAELINDAPKTGLNCDENVYFVINEAMNGAFDLSMYLAVDNFGKLESYIASNSMYAVQADKVGDYTHAIANLGGQSLNVLYNKQLFVLTVSDDLKSKIKPVESLTSYKWFEAFKNNDDLTIVTQAQFVQELANFFSSSMVGQSGTGLAGSVDLPQGLYQAMILNFEKGQVVYTQKMFAESIQAQSFIDSSVDFFGEASAKFVPQIAVDPFVFLNMSVYGDKLLNYLNKVFAGKLSADQIGEDQFNMLQEGVDGINGELTFAVSNVNLNFLNPSVDFSLFCEAKPSLYPFLVKQVKASNYGLSAIQFETDDVLTLSERGFTVYLVNAGDHIILTTDEALSQDPSLKMESDVSKSRYYKRSDDKMYFVLDIQKILAMPMVQMVLSTMPADKFPGAVDFINGLDYVQGTCDSSVSQSKLIIKNKEENSLKLITALLKSLAHL